MKSIIKSSRPARDGELCPSFDHSRQNGPVVEYNYQSGNAALRGAPVFRSKRESFSGFRALSDGFFAAEAKREYFFEAASFVVIVALAAWPMVQAAQALLDLMK